MRTRAVLLGSVLLCACTAAQTGAESSSGAIGAATLAITTVPTGVQCIRIVTTPAVLDAAATSNPVTTDENVSVGAASASYALGQLPLGDVTFTGSAYAAACGSVTPKSVADWIADPVQTNLRTGAPATVALTFRRNNPVTGSVSFVDNLISLSVGVDATFGVFGSPTDSTIRVWGGDAFSNPFVPCRDGVCPPRASNIVAVSAGSESQCSLSADGAVACWGSSKFGQLGPKAPTTGSASAVPYHVTLPGPAIQLASGASFNCALLSNGDLACWGKNSFRQLGAAIAFSATPLISGFTKLAQVAAGGFHVCAVAKNSLVECNGSNASGQLGDGSTVDGSSSSLFGATAVTAGLAHTCALTVDGRVACWGNNTQGQLGNGTFINGLSPSAVALPAPAVEVAASKNGTCARLSTGAVYCWGNNGAGELGNNATLDVSATPVPVVGISHATRLVSASQAHHVCAQMQDLTVRCWGYNNFGQIGDGTTTDRFAPVQVQE